MKLVLFSFAVAGVLFSTADSTAAPWWKKDKSAEEESSKEELSNRSASSRAGSVSRGSTYPTSGRDTDKFLSYSEQKEKELQEEKEEKGLFIRFPWTKKEDEKEEEVADPFGSVKEEAPKYQDLSELGIQSSGQQNPGVAAANSGIPANSDGSFNPSAAGNPSGMGSPANVGSPAGMANPAGMGSSAGMGIPSNAGSSASTSVPAAANSSNLSMEAGNPIPAGQNSVPGSVPPEMQGGSGNAGISGNAGTVPQWAGAQTSSVNAGGLPSELPSDLSSASSSAPIGSAVELPATLDGAALPAQLPDSPSAGGAMENAQNALGTGAGESAGVESSTPSENGTQAQVQQEPPKPQADAILMQVPSLMADTSNLAGEGIQYYQHGQVMAQVGTQVILSGDVLPKVESLMEAHRDKIPEQYWDMQKEMVTRTVLNHSIESKLIYCDVLRNVPGDAIQQNFQLIDDLFEDSELPARMKKAGVENREDYEKILAEEGSCILKQKYLYREAVFCQQWLMKNLPDNPTISHPEVLDFYRENPKLFEIPPQARWEELVVRKSRFYSRDEAYQEMVRIGSLVAVQKMPFADAAKEFSHGVTASDGGVQDWIKPGQLASNELEEAIFSQPVGELSAQIIEDEQCFYVIRVLERNPLVRKTLSECETEIRGRIKLAKVTKAREEYFAKLRREIPVFTIFDGIPTPEERIQAQQEAAAAQSRRQGFF